MGESDSRLVLPLGQGRDRQTVLLPPPVVRRSVGGTDSYMFGTWIAAFVQMVRWPVSLAVETSKRPLVSRGINAESDDGCANMAHIMNGLQTLIVRRKLFVEIDLADSVRAQHVG